MIDFIFLKLSQCQIPRTLVIKISHPFSTRAWRPKCEGNSKRGVQRSRATSSATVLFAENDANLLLCGGLEKHQEHKRAFQAVMTPTCSSARGLSLPARRLIPHHARIEPETSAFLRCVPSLGRCDGHRVRAVSGAASIEISQAAGPRPPCFQEVWIAPNPSRLIKDKRAFLEEHRSVADNLS